MRDYLADWYDKNFHALMLGVLAVIICGLLILLWSAWNRDTRLMQQCLDDGHKEYQCVGLVHGRG